MRYNDTASEEYKSYLNQSSVESYFTVRIDTSNNAGTAYIYITNSTSAQHPVSATVYDSLLDFYGSTTQSLNFSSRISSIGNLIVKLVDVDKVFNAAIVTLEANGYSLTNAEITVYEGFGSMAWDDYVIGRRGYIKKYKWQDGGYSIEAKDAQILLNKKIFQDKSTTLIQPISETDTFLQLTSITGWEPVEHSGHFTDGQTVEGSAGFTAVGNGTAKVTFTGNTVLGKCSDGDRMNVGGADYVIKEITGGTELYLTTTLAANTYTSFTIYPKFIYLKIDDEKIRCPYGYLDFTNHTASNVGRGALGTSAKKHSPGADQLIKNGSFLKSTKWTTNGAALSSNWTIDPDFQKITHTTSTDPFDQVIDDLTENTIYTVQFNIFDRTTGTVSVELGGTSSAALSANQSHSVQITAGNATTKYLQFIPTTGFDGSIDNISLVVTRISSDKLEVKQHVYIEMELVKFMKAIMVGALANQDGENIPSYWEGGLAAANLDLTSFTTIGTDIYDESNETGVIIHFDGEKEQDLKQFLEQELLIGMFMIVTGDNKLSLRRQPKAAAWTASVMQFGANNFSGNVLEISELAHDTSQVFNRFSLHWEWSDVLEKYRRETDLVDATSASKHGAQGSSEYKIVKYRGLRGSNHTTEYVTQILENYHSAFSGAPSLLRIKVQFEATRLEVGDVIGLDMESLQVDTPVDLGYAGVWVYDRATNNFIPKTVTSVMQSFVVTRINVDPWEQVVTLDLYGATGDPDAVEPTGRTEVLDDTWYVGQGGTDISGLVGYSTDGTTGSLTSNITLNGQVDPTSASAIYYLDRHLTIDAGVTITGNKNVRFYIAGEVNINGTLDLSGGGDTGRVYTDGNQNDYADGWDDSVSGYQINAPVGYTSSSGGLSVYRRSSDLTGLSTGVKAGDYGHSGSTEGTVLLNANPQIVSSTSFTPYGYDLRGVGGAAGGGVIQVYLNQYVKMSNGGTGGDGGSGAMFVCRGFVFGVSGNITTSGDTGVEATQEQAFSFYPTAVGGSGSGGAAGGLIIYLDGAGATQPVFTGSNHIARYGATPLPTQSITHWIDNGYSNDPYRLSGYMTAVPPISQIDVSQGMRLVKYLGDNSQKYSAPNVEGPKPISNLTVTSGTDYLRTLPDGTVVSGALIDWDGSLDKDVYKYDIFWRKYATTGEIDILSISSASPPVVTTDGNHIFSTGDKVRLTDSGIWYLNGTIARLNRITVLTATTFEIDVHDTTTSNAAVAGGTVELYNPQKNPWAYGAVIIAPDTDVLLYGMFADAATYDFKVGSINIHQRYSNFLELTNQTITGKSVAPSPPTSVTVRSDPAGARLEWVCPADLDMSIYEIYMSSANTIPTNPLYRVAASTAGTNQYYTIPLHEGTSKYFWIKGRDTSELLSTAVASVPANYKRPLATIINPTATFRQEATPLGSDGDIWYKPSEGTHYRIDGTNNLTEHTTALEASDGAATDEFGFDCSLSSDGLVLAVGARNRDNGGTSEQGAVYVFDWNGSSWVERTTALLSSDGGANDRFGTSVGLSSDGTVLAVGAPNWDGDTYTDQGAVYVFDWNGSSWVERTTALVASDAGTNDYFGTSVGLSGDGTVLAVGAPDWDGGGGFQQGTVYIFDWDGSLWVERAGTVTSSDAGANDYFGFSCSLSSDGDVLVAGAYGWDGGTYTDQGAVYVFDWNGSSWVERTTALVASDAAANDHFGGGVNLANNSKVLVVGAQDRDTGGASNQGAVYVFDWNGSSWVERTTILTASDGLASDWFGYGTGISSDGTIVCVGSGGWNNGATSNQGAVYVFNAEWQPISDQTGSHILETFSDDLVIDGDMERDDVLYWSAGAGAPTKDTSNFKYGTQCLKVTSSTGAHQSYYDGRIIYIPVETGDTFRISFWGKVDSGTLNVRLGWIQGDKTTTGTPTLYTETATTWTRTTATGVVVPANMRYLSISTYMSVSGVGYLDAVLVKRE